MGGRYTNKHPWFFIINAPFVSLRKWDRFLKQKMDEAKPFLQKAIHYGPDNYLGYFSLGLMLEEKKDFEGAVKYYLKAVKLNPVYAPNYYHLGTFYAKKGDKRALWHLKEAVRLNPQFAEAHNNLAVLYASIEPPRWDLARKHALLAQELGYNVEESC